MLERWVVIDDYPNYSVSSNGRVMNNKYGRILKTRPDTKGYHRVCLYNNSNERGSEMLVHRLVAEAFCDGYQDGLDVNHIDGCKDNNIVDNLEWCTRSENLKHCYQTGLRDSPKNRCKSVRILETGEVFDSVRDCARYLGCEHSNISLCLHGSQKTCKGYHFEFYNE